MRRIRIAFVLPHLLAGLLFAGCEDNTLSTCDIPPAVPTGVITVTGDGEVTIFWNPVWEEDVAGYGVYRSATLDGAYVRIATREGVATDYHTDSNVVNGTTYFYAVDAYDLNGNESALSYEDAFDTPRPDGTGILVMAREEVPSSSALDFSLYGTAGFVTSHIAAYADLVVLRDSGVLYAVGTVIGGFPNDIQDMGYTYTMDEISWAPAEGWSISPTGVELIPGHTYVVWTWDSHFAKFRVTEEYFTTPGIPAGVQIDWAYQTDLDNPELSPAYSP